MFAHRGGSKLRPENTLVAFDHGLSLGADGLEFDVRLSSDGVPMVHHDATLDRTTSGTGPLSAHTADALQQLDAGHHFTGLDGEPWRGRGCGIPRLEMVLARYPAVPIIMELKGDDPEVARRAVALVRGAGAIGRVCFAGFEDAVVRAARARGTDVVSSAARRGDPLVPVPLVGRCGAAADGLPGLPGAGDGGRASASCRVASCVPRGGPALPVAVWTVDEPAAMERLLAWGVRGLISDRPDLAVPVVRRWKASR